MARRKKIKKKKGLWSKQSNYVTVDGKDILMDSTWEVACAKKLDELNIKWDRGSHLVLPYVSKRGRVRKYIPDFYLTELDTYIEVKGYWTDSARYKMKDVQEKNPVKIIFLESLKDIENIEKHLIFE
jgi:hypothetical protein